MLNQASDGLTHQNPNAAHAFWCDLLMRSGSSGEARRTQPPKCYGLQDLPAMLEEAGFSAVETGDTSFRLLGFVRGGTASAEAG